MIKEKNGLEIIESLVQALDLQKKCAVNFKNKPEANKQLENDLKKLNRIYKNAKKENKENLDECLIVLQALQMCPPLENRYFSQIF